MRFKNAAQLINDAGEIIIIQAENPDGDSLASSLALEEILGDLGKTVRLFCPVDIPRYLHYLNGWDRVSSNFSQKADLAVIVDTSAEVLMSKALDMPDVRHFLQTRPVLVIDHHTTKPTLSFPFTPMLMEAVSTGEVIFRLARKLRWPINTQAAEHLMISILSDSLGLTTPSVTADTFKTAGELVKLGAVPATIENRRREYMKKTQAILSYKGDLIKRIQYFLDGKLALIHIPWEEIAAYSDQYNPSMLVIDEMRLVEGVEAAIAIKSYPDGKVTGKVRTNLPIAENIAGYFGGGGHLYAAGFRIYEELDKVNREIVVATDKALKDYANENQLF